MKNKPKANVWDGLIALERQMLTARTDRPKLGAGTQIERSALIADDNNELWWIVIENRYVGRA